MAATLAVCLVLLFAALFCVALYPHSSTTFMPAALSMRQSLLGQLELYKLDHGAPPDLTKYPNGEQLMARTRADGQITPAGEGPFGPYLSAPLANPNNGLTNILLIRGPAPTQPVAPLRAGWLYYHDASLVIETDATGTLGCVYGNLARSPIAALQRHCSGRNVLTGALHIATSRDDTDPVWLLAIPFGPPIAINVVALFVVIRAVRRPHVAVAAGSGVHGAQE